MDRFGSLKRTKYTMVIVNEVLYYDSKLIEACVTMCN